MCFVLWKHSATSARCMTWCGYVHGTPVCMVWYEMLPAFSDTRVRAFSMTYSCSAGMNWPVRVLSIVSDAPHYGPELIRNPYTVFLQDRVQYPPVALLHTPSTCTKRVWNKIRPSSDISIVNWLILHVSCALKTTGYMGQVHDLVWVCTWYPIYDVWYEVLPALSDI